MEKALARNNLTLSHGKALDLLAGLCGLKDWNSHVASLSVEAINEQLHDFELSHLRATGDETYENEHCLAAHNSFQLRYEPSPNGCDYVRVCDPLGRELMYRHT